MLTGGLVVALAVVFAYNQNPPLREPPALPAESVPPPPTVTPSLVEAGRRVYADKACARCHSIGGRGNPRSPLDGVGARLGEEEIRRWITPAATPAENFQSRHANLALTASQREALVAYLRSLRNAAPPVK